MASKIDSLAESALQAYLVAQDITENILTGKASEEKEAPCVICVSDGAIEDERVKGNYTLTARVIARGVGVKDAEDDTPKEDADTIVADTHDALMMDDLANSLTTAQDGFTCIGIISRDVDSGTSSDMLEETMTLKLYCCASNLS